MKNKEIADIFERIALMLEIKDDNVFKIRAYQKASENILALGEDIAHVKCENRSSEIPAVGQALREKIIEYLETGKVSAYQSFKNGIPESILEI